MIARLRKVTYAYPGSMRPALDEVDLDLDAGQFALVTGPSAGGKSTLLRTFNGLVPQFHGGSFGGEIRVGEADPSRTPARTMARIAGMVFQEPEAQGVGSTVEDDIVFGMEQLGVPPVVMERRLESLTERLGLAHLRMRTLSTLSGGERQRAAIAAAMAMEPALLLCDEPTSQLDPAGAEDVARALEQLSRGGTTVVIAEHRLERFLSRATQLVTVTDGRVGSGDPRELVGEDIPWLPPFVELARRAGAPPPLSVAEAAKLDFTRLSPAPRSEPPPPGDVLLDAAGLSVRYGDATVLQDAELSVREGEIVALMGPNGSGKTTLLRGIAGLAPLAGGAVSLRGKPAAKSVQDRSALAGLVPQDPAVALYRETVRDEVATGLAYRKGLAATVDSVLDRWRIAHLEGRNPRDLSVGQQLRVAVAAMLAHEPPLWLLDEPTRGADTDSRAWIAAALRDHAAAGGAAVVSTHDVDAAASFATRVVGIEEGRVVFDLPARRAFGPAGPHPTSIARLVPWAITLEDIA